MVIVVDAGGAAAGLRPVVEGAWRAASAQGHQLVFVGPEQGLRAELRALSAEGALVSIVDAPAVLQAGEDPVAACREQPESSAMRAAERAAAQKGSALVSLGDPRGAAAAALWHLKRLRGVLRPAVACPVPTRRGATLLLDAGANADCKPWHLLQFALMGSLYAKRVLRVPEPAVGLLAPGSDACGETELLRETQPLLKYAGLKFAGKVRADRLSAGEVDVAVCDGATGDQCLRAAEGLTETCFEILKSELASSLGRRLGARLLGGALQAVEERFCRATSRPSPVLGLGGAAVLCRGGASAGRVAEAVKAAAALAESDLAERIQERLEDVKSDMEFARALD